MEMCPACGQISNMISYTSMRTKAGSSGKKKWIKTITFHCEQCRHFVRSEDREGLPVTENPPDRSADLRL